MNPEAFRGRGVIKIFLEEGTTLYRGWGWTMARNAPGSFAVSSFTIYSLQLFIRPCAALRCFGGNKRLRSRRFRLFQSNLDPKFHRINCRSCRIYHSRSSSGRRENSYPERELREQDVWRYSCQRINETRGSWSTVQGIDAQSMYT